MKLANSGATVMSDNPYEVLGLEPDATPEEINAAYRAASKSTHPDGGGSTEEFTRVKGAAMVLLDPDRRKRFDETGTIDEGKPDNSLAEVMEAIANFFISSIDVSDQFGAPQLADLNLVEAATTHFKNQVHGAKQHIQKVESKIKKFERALKRLKSKRQDDIVGNMLNHHVSSMRGLITSTQAQIKQFEMAVEILNDYEFESPYAHHSNPYVRHGFLPPGGLK
jgi:curved DNA-binding protein CbpA